MKEIISSTGMSFCIDVKTLFLIPTTLNCTSSPFHIGLYSIFHWSLRCLASWLHRLCVCFHNQEMVYWGIINNVCSNSLEFLCPQRRPPARLISICGSIKEIIFMPFIMLPICYPKSLSVITMFENCYLNCLWTCKTFFLLYL